MDETKGHVCFENAFRVGVHGPIHSASVPRQRMQSMDVLKFVAIFFVLWGMQSSICFRATIPTGWYIAISTPFTCLSL